MICAYCDRKEAMKFSSCCSPRCYTNFIIYGGKLEEIKENG